MFGIILSMFLNSKLRKLQEQENIIYKYLRNTSKEITEIEEYFNIFLTLMCRDTGDVDSQLIYATVFAKYLTSFVSEETNHLSDKQINDMRFAAKKILIDLKNGYTYQQ
jgi:hypothetical protein